MEKFKNEFVFNSVFFKPEIIGQDLSREEEEIFEEVPPFTVDPETGKLINETSQPMLISKGKINVFEKIQSFRHDADIYAILEKYAASGDMSIINVSHGEFGDTTKIPNNLNDICQYTRALFKGLEEMNPELAKMVLDENVKPEDIEARANEIYQMRIDDYNKSGEAKEGANNE